jgi:Ni/Co efflux regulator RcnB
VNKIKTVVASVLLASVVGLSPAVVVAQDNPQYRDRQDDRRDNRDHDRDRDRDRERERYRNDHRRPPRTDWRRYDYNHPEAGYRYYDASRYYEWDANRYRERRLGRNDRVYRGMDDQYYCRRSDGTTGLIVGGLAGGAIGNLLAPGDSRTLGTILGAAGGAAIGRSIDRNNVVCR